MTLIQMIYKEKCIKDKCPLKWVLKYEEVINYLCKL